MKRTVILIFLFAISFLGYSLLNNVTTASVTSLKGDCCKTICLSNARGPIDGCDVFLYHNGNLVDRGTTNSSGQYEFCGLTNGYTYTVIPQCDCTISGGIPSFTACEISDVCLQIFCE